MTVIFTFSGYDTVHLKISSLLHFTLGMMWPSISEISLAQRYVRFPDWGKPSRLAGIDAPRVQASTFNCREHARMDRLTWGGIYCSKSRGKRTEPGEKDEWAAWNSSPILLFEAWPSVSNFYRRCLDCSYCLSYSVKNHFIFSVVYIYICITSRVAIKLRIYHGCVLINSIAWYDLSGKNFIEKWISRQFIHRKAMSADD